MFKRRETRESLATFGTLRHMSDKPEVLVVAARYRPGYKAGGPVASVENLARALGGEFDFQVLALDHDLGETEPYPMELRRPEAVYVSQAEAANAVVRHVRQARGIVYVQSLFSPVWGMLPILYARRGRLLVAPRGQLSAGAMAQGALKKRVSLRGIGAVAERKGAFWQATAESDAAEMRTAMPWVDPSRILLAPNLPSDPGFVLRRRFSKAVYVGRIDPKKNLLTAVRAAVAAGVELDVVGPAEDAAYAEECRRAANERVRFLGPMPPDGVREALASSSVFLFPTFGENYGHSIVEAMLSGLPALVGNTTPWRGLEVKQAGFDLSPDDVEGFAAALRRLAGMPEGEFALWSQGARAAIEAATEREAAVEASRRMLSRVFQGV